MFRRKDESADLLSNDMTSTGSASATSPASEASKSDSSSASAPSMASSGNGYASTGTSAATAGATPRPSEPAKPAAMPNTGMYRPTAPGADMNRGRQDYSRPAAPAAAASPSASSSEKASSNKNSRRILTVGNDILLKGEIATCDRLVIEGRVDASLKDVHTVEIAENGSFKGSAEIEDAEISGLFEGELIVRNRLVIYSSGKVRGTITYGEIEIERGGELTGEIKTVGSAKSSKMEGKNAA